MRVLVLEDNPLDALLVLRELKGQHDVDVATTLGEALACLASSQPPPDIIVTDLTLPDSSGTETIEALTKKAPDIPIVVSTGFMTQSLRAQLDKLGTYQALDKNDGFDQLTTLIQQASTKFGDGSRRDQMTSEIEQIARAVAEEAVEKAIEHLCRRLGLHDEEGVRMAVKLARGWEAAKGRFISAIATGIASALLLALGAGIVAMLRNHGSK